MAEQSKNLFDQIRTELGRKIVESGTISRGEILALWVEKEDLVESIKKLRSLGFDWLLDIWCFELDQVIVVNHVLKRGRNGEVILVRVSAEPQNALDRVHVPSLSALFSNANALERGCDDLFGVTFGDSEESSSVLLNRTLSGEGFPMRKGYVFPHEVDGVRHERRRHESGVATSEMPRIEDI